MHRSGTSAFAGTLDLLGSGMARNLVPAHDSNRKGHYEPEEIVSQNDLAFGETGLSWFHCAEPEYADDSALDARAREILSVVAREYDDSDLIVIKDPRTARLHKLWRRVAELGNWDMRCVVMYRPAGAVVDSLSRRNDWSDVRSTWLWLAHVAGSEQLTAGLPRRFVSANAFLDAPVATLQALEQGLDLHWPVPLTEAEPRISAFLERGMLSEAAATDLPWADKIRAAETALETLSATPEDPGALQALRTLADDIRQSGTAIEDACRASEKYLMGYRAVSENAESLAAERDQLATDLTDVSAARDHLSRKLQELHDVSLWLSDRATRYTRSPLRSLRKRAEYGVAKASLQIPNVKGTRFGTRMERFVSRNSPRRFRRKLDEVMSCGTPASRLPAITGQEAAIPPRTLAQAGSLTPDKPQQDVFVPLTRDPAPDTLGTTVVAFYLPQYHPIEQNDEWWGRGFTEWTNVVPAKPQFDDHYQPHLPGELGYYDLRVPEIQERQAELARLYGIGAFCYYFYWFAGQTLLERPLRAMLDNPGVDIPFCLCWANENWTRTWDGYDSEVLIAQDHGPRDDLEFIKYVSDYLRDPRYLRVNGAPVLIVYRPNLLPDMKATAAIWRTWCRENGIGEIHLCMTQSFEDTDPAEYGLDASIEFPPNNTAPPNITQTLAPVSPDYSGQVYDWTVFPERARAYSEPAYPVYRGVCTSWDNTARRAERGTWFKGATPDGFRDWLSRAMEDTISRKTDRSDRLVFVNAWNEWAEGAHLEPDQRYGYAWLQAVREAHEQTVQGLGLSALSAPAALVVHDAHLHGAQFLGRAFARHFREAYRTDLHIVLLGGGELEDDFRALGHFHKLDDTLPRDEAFRKLARALREAGVEHVLVNSIASGGIIPALRAQDLHISVLVHEMPELIAAYGLEDAVRDAAQMADRVIFPGDTVRHGFESIAAIDPARVTVRPQGMFKTPAPRDPAKRARIRKDTRAGLGIAEDAFVGIGIGFGDHRKGVDLFVEAAIEICQSDDTAAFIWIGILHQDYAETLPARVAGLGLTDRILFPGFVDNITDPLLAADVFMLTSREDPFPSVVLDALDAGTTVQAIAGTGGCADLMAGGYGQVVASADAGDIAAGLRGLQDAGLRESYAAQGRHLIETEYSFGRYAFDVLSVEGTRAPRVSVIVPNYNYLHHIEERLRSIAAQSWPIYEVIVLDDASTDGSAEWLEANLEEILPGAILRLNTENSGSVFRQWQRGLEMAQGDLVWIAEADDACDPAMLARLVAQMEDPEVRIAYCQSRAISSDGAPLSDDYTDYTATLDRDLWSSSFVVSGNRALKEHFAVKNVIPNVSAVLFRRDPLVAVLQEMGDEIGDWSVAGDWRIYAGILSEGGKVAFEAEALNIHRRHQNSVTHALKKQRHFDEIAGMQSFVAGQVDVSDATKHTAESYLQEVRAYLKL